MCLLTSFLPFHDQGGKEIGIDPKAIQRFINEHNTGIGLKLNNKATNSKDIFLYYILYEIL